MATTHPIAPTPSRTESAKHRANLEEFERHDGRPAFVLNMTEVKLLGIAGVREIFYRSTLIPLIFVIRLDFFSMVRCASSQD